MENAQMGHEKEVMDRMIRAGQGHVFRWLGELDPEGRRRLLSQAEGINLDLLDHLVKGLSAPQGASAPHPEILPAPIVRLPATPQEQARARDAQVLGERLLREGKVAALTVAGGQGSRLGFEGPKGTFPIGPITQKSIFQLHAERVLAHIRRHGAPIPWYLMTSESNDAATREFFKKNDFFGLPPGDVKFFQQGMLPAVDRSGRLILDAKDHIFVSPDGHGGSLIALKRTGMVEDMRRRGIQEICYSQVDNVLVKILDPVFLGYHVASGAEMSSKVIPKRDAEEKVGVIGMVNGRLTVIEYSDLSREEKYAVNKDGTLKHWAGSIAIHVLNVNFVNRITSAKLSLPYHRAEKAVPCLDERGQPVTPKEKNAIKFETFVFDALGLAKASVTQEVRREDEFAPVKDAEGADSPQSARTALVNRWGRWLRQAGVAVPADASGNVLGLIEIGPLFALDAGELLRKLKGREVRFDGRLLLE